MTDRSTIKIVITFTGAAVLLFGLATVVLALRVLDQSSGAQTVDAAALGVVAIPAGFCNIALGALVGMLASTRSTPDKAEIEAALAPLAEMAPTQVEVVQPADTPVPVEVAPPAL